MQTINPHLDAAERVPWNSRREMMPAVILLVFLILGSAGRLAFNFGYNYAVFETVEVSHPHCCVNFLESYLIPITICLCVALVGLLIKRRVGFYLTTVSLIGIGVLYLLWYRATLSVIRDAELASFSQLPDQAQKVLPLNGATWWDLVVLAVVIGIFIWQIACLTITKRGPYTSV